MALKLVLFFVGLKTRANFLRIYTVDAYIGLNAYFICPPKYAHELFAYFIIRTYVWHSSLYKIMWLNSVTVIGGLVWFFI
jgi:hypothetical protein